MKLLKEFWLFVKEEKKWWLLPFILVILLVGLLAMFAGGPLGPLLYPFM